MSPDPCREVSAAIHDYLDGQCDPQLEAGVSEHLQQCPPCSHLIAFEQAVRARVRRSCGCEQAPPDLKVRIMARITRIQVTYREGYPGDRGTDDSGAVER